MPGFTYVNGDRVRVILGLPSYHFGWNDDMTRTFEDHPEGTVVAASNREVIVEGQNGDEWLFAPQEITGLSDFHNSLEDFPKKKKR